MANNYNSTYLKTFLSYIKLLVVLICLIPTGLKAQDEKKEKKKLKMNGNFSFSHDMFSSTSNDPTFIAYRPQSSSRLFAGTSISYGRFSLPFSFSYSLQQGTYGYASPIPSEFRLRDLMSFYNQLSFSPTYKSFQALIGTQVPTYSELTSGDLPVFGGGFIWRPRKIRISAFYGIAQRGIASDSLLNIPGAYKRTSFGTKIGIGDEEGTHLYLIGLRHQDDPNSVIVKSFDIKPEDNTVLSVDQKLVIAKKFFIKTELALSAYSSDLKEATLESDSFKLNIHPILRSLYTPRFSSRYGAAGTSAIGYTGNNWSLKFVNRIFSPDYRTLNLPFLQTDRLEYTIDPAFTLFKGKFSFQGSYGQRTDNLLNNKIAKTNTKLLSININGRFTNSWAYNFSHSNFGIQNTITNDTLRLNNISENYTLGSTYVIQRKKVNHIISGMWSKAAFEDYNIVSGSQSNNETQTFMLMYSASLLKTPLTISLSGTHLQNKLFLGDLAMQIITFSQSYSIGKKQNVNLSFSQNYQMTSLFNSSPDKAINLGGGINFVIGKGFSLGANANMNILRYGSTKPGIQNMENMLRMLTSYSF
jgi:hypothetical protein